MFSFLKKKGKEKQEYKAYVSGNVIPVSEVGDGMFSEKMMGDGIAIEPEDEMLCSPADGEVTVIMDGSFHAAGIRTESGVELLLHIGLDTVGMQGEGFQAFVKPGDKVKAGDSLISFSKTAIASHELRDIVIMVVTNQDECPAVTFKSGMHAAAGETTIAECEG